MTKKQGCSPGRPFRYVQPWGDSRIPGVPAAGCCPGPPLRFLARSGARSSGWPITRGDPELAAFARVGMLFTFGRYGAASTASRSELREPGRDRHADRSDQPPRLPAGLRARAAEGGGAARAPSPWSRSTSTTSRRSTSGTAIPSATASSRVSAAQLRKAVRRGDTAARTGGEEFALILPGTAAEAAQEITERVRTAVARLSPAGSELSCSAGVAVYPVDADNAGTLLQLAEGALYWAKRSGKSQDAALRPRPRPAQRRRPAALGDRAHPRGARDRAALPARRLPHHRPTDRLRGSRRASPTPRTARPRPGSLRPTPAASAPSWRPRRSRRPSRPTGAHRERTSPSTSAPRRSPPTPSKACCRTISPT